MISTLQVVSCLGFKIDFQVEDNKTIPVQVKGGSAAQSIITIVILKINCSFVFLLSSIFKAFDTIFNIQHCPAAAAFFKEMVTYYMTKWKRTYINDLKHSEQLFFFLY